MNIIDKITLADIVNGNVVYIAPENTELIWKSSVPNEIVKKGCEELNRVNDCNDLDRFIEKYERYIDKVQFLIAIERSLRDREKNSFMDKQEKVIIGSGLEVLRQYLGSIDETRTFLNRDEKTHLIKSVSLFKTQDIANGIDRRHNNNQKRLEELKKDIDLSDLVQAIFRVDIESTITNEPEMGKALVTKINYNTIAKKIPDIKERGALQLEECNNLAKEMPIDAFQDEILETIEQNIEEIDFDKLLLVVARNFFALADLIGINAEDVNEAKSIIEITKKHIKNKKAEVPTIDGGSYTFKNIEQDLRRFISLDDKDFMYIKKSECEKIKNSLLNGEISLNSVPSAIFDILDLIPKDVSKILRENPNNYIFFLEKGSNQYSKNVIVRDIINKGQCSTKLLQLLCTKMGLTSDEICNLYDKEIVHVDDLRAVRELTGPIVTTKNLFEKYKDYKESNESEREEARIALERYALAYRNTELLGKTSEEIEQKGNEFVLEMGDKVESQDFIPLYNLGIIPLQVAADWGGENIIQQLLETESLKPADARYLRDKGLLDQNILERLFKNCTQMSYAYQVSLVYTVFDGITEEEQQIREELAQYYNIENALSNHSKNDEGKKRVIKQNLSEEQQVKKIKMRDPGAKYNLLAGVDPDVKVEEGITDGHIIFHYPNIDGGTVWIEKLHRITKNKQNGLIEIKAENQSASYSMTEEEFIKLKPELIKDGKVDRSELTQRWWITRDPEHWFPHVGTKIWEESFMNRCKIKKENPMYSKEDIEKIESLMQKSIESKIGEER